MSKLKNDSLMAEREVMTSALRPLERYILYSKVSIHEAPAALHDMAFTYTRTEKEMRNSGSNGDPGSCGSG